MVTGTPLRQSTFWSPDFESLLEAVIDTPALPDITETLLSMTGGRRQCLCFIPQQARAGLEM